MFAAAAKGVWQAVSLSWLTGPIFSKELRVASRRRRNYWLRFVHIAVLTVFVAVVWAQTVSLTGYGGSAAYRISRMSLAGQIIVGTIVWFQFIAMQLVAVVMLSTAVSDEIYSRTLGLLMTTPITSLQVILGKLLSKLWQMFVLLAISLPLLAVVRVFGGVPWDFLISSLCITATAVILAGSLSMYFSIRSRQAYAVILKTLLVGGILFALLPWLVIMLGPRHLDKTHWLFSVVLLSNPFGAFGFNQFRAFAPGLTAGMPFSSWPLHCAIMLGLSALVLARTIAAVRKVALRLAGGESAESVVGKRRRKRLKSLPAVETSAEAVTEGPRPLPAVVPDRPEAGGRIRRVTGSPVIWKELMSPILRGRRRAKWIGMLAMVFVLLLTYFIVRDDLSSAESHVIYSLVFILIGMLLTAVLSATSITTEKESRSWPILLCTPLSDWHILLGKAVGVLRRCMPVWLLLFGHVVLFIAVRLIHPIAILHLSMLVAWLLVFMTGSGLYFSAQFKHTTTAVVMNISLGLLLWIGVPIVLGILSIGGGMSDDLIETSLVANPVAQTIVIMDGASGSYNTALPSGNLRYEWPELDADSAGETTGTMAVVSGCYMLAGCAFAVAAKGRLRKNVI